MTTKTEYRTTDLYLAAFLQTRGFVLKAAERDNQQITFVFAGGAKLTETLGTWLTGAEVNALAYASSLKQLKGMIGHKLQGSASVLVTRRRTASE